MFGTARRFPGFPLRGLLLIALGFILASAFAGSGSGLLGGLGVVLLIPLFLFKMFFLFMLFGFMLRFIGPGSSGGPGWGPGPWGKGPWHSGHPHTQGDEGGDDPTAHSGPQRDQADWDESLRWARRKVEEADRPAPGPQPPADPAGPQDSVDPDGRQA